MKIANGEVKTKKRLPATVRKMFQQPEDNTSVDLPKEAPPEAKKTEAPKKKRTQKKKASTEVVKQNTSELSFPVEAFVNDYVFLKIRKKVLEKIGWPNKKFDVTLDIEGGALIVKKKA